jgi:carbon dioxide concentrating mechanism protein CcmO
LNQALALVEMGGWSPAMVVLDAMEKTAGIRTIQVELNDQPGVCMKLAGPVASLQAAVEAARSIADQMQVTLVADVIPAPAAGLSVACEAQADFSPLLEQATVVIPHSSPENKEIRMSEQANFAVGLIETQGFIAVFEAIDTALKTAAVEVLAREKLGGGFITVVIRGDVAAVNAAVEAGKARVGALGRLVAAHVIPSPSAGVLSLLPKL